MGAMAASVCLRIAVQSGSGASPFGWVVVAVAIHVSQDVELPGSQVSPMLLDILL